MFSTKSIIFITEFLDFSGNRHLGNRWLQPSLPPHLYSSLYIEMMKFVLEMMNFD